MIRALLRHPLLRFAPLALVLVIGAALSAASLIWARQIERRRVQAEFDGRAAEIDALVSRRIGANLEVPSSVERLYAASNQVDAAEFERFTRHALATYPGLRVLGWAAREPAPGGDRVIVRFASPAERARQFIGIDLTRLPGCAPVMEAARDQALLRATEPVDLSAARAARAGGAARAATPARGAASSAATAATAATAAATATTAAATGETESDTRYHALAFLPVYRGGEADPTTWDVTRRRADHLGFVVAALRLDQMLRSAMADVDLHGQEIRLYDDLPATETPADTRAPAPRALRALRAPTPAATTDQNPPTPIYHANAGPEIALRRDIDPWRRPLELGGRRWWLVGAPTQAYRPSKASFPIWSLPAVGMTFTLLLGAYLHTLGNRAARVQALVSKRTLELQNANQTLAREIDERRRTEAALSESEERHRVVVQRAADGITLVDAETLRIIEVNEAFARLLGYAPEELAGRQISELIVDTPEGVSARAQQTLGAAATGTAATAHRQYRRRDGGIVDVEKSATVLRLGGRPVLCTVVHDVTERKNAEEALRRSEARTRQIVETALDAFVAMDADGRIAGWNAQAEKTFGWSRQEAMGRLLADTIIPPRYRQRHHAGIEHFLATGDGPLLNQRIEITALRHDGHEFPIELTIAPLRVGQSYHFNAFIHDITERRRREQALREQHEQLEAAIEQLKQAQGALVQSEKLAGLGQLVAGVAHEINNPLSFVGNNVAVLQRDVRALCELLDLYRQSDDLLAQHRAELLDAIRDLSQRMDLEYTRRNLQDLLTRSREGLGRIQQIVKDLREFARLDKGDLQEASLNAGIESTINIVRGLAKKKQVGLELQLGALRPLACHPAKINQVVMNLVTNAIDASPANGTVTVRSTHDPAADAARIEVIDQGGGIDPAIAEKIFDPFFTTKPIGKGTGLGLSISYGIVKEHGGAIAVESEPGKGSRFVVTLPYSTSRSAPAGHPRQRGGADEDAEGKSGKSRMENRG